MSSNCHRWVKAFQCATPSFWVIERARRVLPIRLFHDTLHLIRWCSGLLIPQGIDQDFRGYHEVPFHKGGKILGVASKGRVEDPPMFFRHVALDRPERHGQPTIAVGLHIKVCLDPA